MMRRMLIALVVVLGTFSLGQVEKASPELSHGLGVLVRDGVFHSPSLDRDMKYRIILPGSYDTGSGRFPVLYLLHGLGGNYLDWDTRTDLERYAEHLPLIIVMPDADDSWYTDSVSNPKDKFETYIAKDLIAEIDAKYRTIQVRYSRAVAGLSMGGYAAMKLALKYPDEFVFAGSFSGAQDAGGDLEKRESQYHEKMLQIYGPDGSQTRRDNNVLLLVDKVDLSHLPYLYVACGTEDFLLTSNRQFVAKLSSRKIAYEYHESAGAHDWDYWDRMIRRMLPVVMEKVMPQAPHAPR